MRALKVSIIRSCHREIRDKGKLYLWKAQSINQQLRRRGVRQQEVTREFKLLFFFFFFFFANTSGLRMKRRATALIFYEKYHVKGRCRSWDEGWLPCSSSPFHVHRKHIGMHLSPCNKVAVICQSVLQLWEYWWHYPQVSVIHSLRRIPQSPPKAVFSGPLPFPVSCLNQLFFPKHALRPWHLYGFFLSFFSNWLLSPEYFFSPPSCVYCYDMI